MTQEQALQALRRDPRDAVAWEALATDLYQPLLAYVASLLLTFQIGASDTTDDIIHDVLLALYERWPKIHANIASVEALHRYLRKSCRNLLVDKYRHERRAEPLIRFLTLKFSGAFQNEANLYRHIFLNEIVALLPLDCAALLKDYIERELSPAELADEQKASPAAFYSRWYRCLQRAREVFKKEKYS